MLLSNKHPGSAHPTPKSHMMRLLLLAALMLAGALGLIGCSGASDLSPEERIARAKDYQEKGELRAAIIELKNTLQQAPQNPEARWLLGQIYVEAEQGAAAEKELAKASELGIDEEPIKLPLGQALLLQGKFKRVLSEITLSDSTPQENRAAILRMRGDATLGLGELEEGCQIYKQSVELDANHVPAYWGLASCAYARKDLDETRALIDTALRIDEANAATWVMLGDFERRSDNQQAAMEAYSRALEHDPNNLTALFNRAVIQVFTSKRAEAEADLVRMKKLAPAYFGTRMVEGWLRYADGELDPALDALRQALKVRPNYGPGILLLALVQYDRKAYEQAAQALTTYVQQAPGILGARKLLAATYLRLNQPDAALALLNPHIASGKADAQVLALAGDAHLRSDDPEHALALYEKSADLVPTSAMLRTKLGLSRLAAGEETAGVEELQSASSLSEKDFRADAALAYHYLGKKQFDKALAVIDVLEKKLPNNPGPHNLKGQAYLGKKDLSLARKSFEQALTLQPNLVSAAVRLAKIDIVEKNIPAARGRYQAILENDAENVPAMVGLAELAGLEENEAEYLEWLDRAARANTSAFVPRMMMTKYYLGKGEHDRALALAREAVFGRPNSPEALALLGRAQLAAGKKESALSTFQQLVELAPNSAVAHHGLAKAHATVGSASGTRESLYKALEINSTFGPAARALVALEKRTGRSEAALRVARNYRAAAPTAPLGWYLEGEALMASRSYTEAALAYEKALVKTADSRVAIKLHMARSRAGKATTADQALFAWLESYPDDTVVRTYLAQSYLERELNDQAIEQYQTLARLLPNSASTLNNLAILYQKEGNPSALETAEKAYKLRPDDPAVADTLGWILVERGDTPKGLELIEKAADGAPNDPDVRFHLASALAQAGQPDRARQELGILQRLKPATELQQQARKLLGKLP